MDRGWKFSCLGEAGVGGAIWGGVNIPELDGEARCAWNGEGTPVAGGGMNDITGGGGGGGGTNPGARKCGGGI